MDDEGGPDRLSFLDAAVPPAFEVRFLLVPHGRGPASFEVDQRDALIVIERGEVDLVGAHGTACRFVRGDIVCLRAVPLRQLRATGADPALVAVVRRRVTRVRATGWPLLDDLDDGSTESYCV